METLDKDILLKSSSFVFIKFLCLHEEIKTFDKPESKSQVQAQSPIERGKRNLDSGEHGWVQHVQGEHYQRNL